ncbi:MAG: 3-oxoacyl-[acyl-carrier-protein] reductase [Planctomycetes bacterium]|nr:3-oxoacyl-[acyl-carrier-protein] reductase [Planctomycetota bacterium]
MFDFENRRVIVTGGSKGIGEAIARQFVERGARVAILARNLEVAEAAAQRMGDRAKAWSVDASDENAVAETFDAVLEEFGGVDVLVNNAGITRDRLLMQMKASDWEDVISVNLRSCFLCSKAVLRPMLRQRSGRIINVTSVIGLMGNAGQSNYAASKSGIIGFTKSLAKELASRSITVNAIAPGMIDTDMTRDLPEETQEQIKSQIPLGRLGTGDDIAAAALYLASDGAAYVTGEVLRVDGGMAI